MKSVRNLGVIIDGNLCFREQIKILKKQIVGNLVNISRISKFVDKPSKLKLVHNLVLSKLDFCNFIYYNLPNVDLRSLQLLINNAVRIVSGVPRFSRNRVTPLSISLHILPLKARIEFKICLLTYKALTYKHPFYIKNLLSYHEHRRELPLRGDFSGKLLEPVFSRYAYSDRCFSSCAPRLYNLLPHEIRNAPSLNSFKVLLKTYLFCKAYDLDTLRVNSEYCAT